MTIQEQIEELLEQIQNQTGILFSITDSQIDEEEMLVTLKICYEPVITALQKRVFSVVFC